MLAKAVQELTAQGKAKPLNVASSNVGASTHLAGDLLRARTGIDATPLPYKGSWPAVGTDGRVSLLFDTMLTAVPMVKSRKLLPMPVTSLQRRPGAPELPSMAKPALTLSRAVGARPLEGAPLGNLSQLALWQGDAAQALIHAQAALDVAMAVQAGGHNAGIISEPGHPRRHYRIALRPAQGPWLHAERWQQQAEQHDGSWWPAWHTWLAARSSKPVRAKPIPADVAVADAPGTFVLKRYAE